MTTGQIASRLAELCRQGQFESAQKELFAENAVSIEPEATADFAKETKGLRNIIESGLGAFPGPRPLLGRLQTLTPARSVNPASKCVRQRTPICLRKPT